MKITLLTPALMAILGLALAGAPVTAQAQTSTNAVTTAAPAATPTPAPVKKTKPTSYAGTLTALDASSVTVTGTKRTLILAVATTTIIQKDGKMATLADFAVGDKVTGSYTTDATGAMTAHSLRKKTPKTPAAPATTAAPAPAAAPATQ